MDPTLRYALVTSLASLAGTLLFVGAYPSAFAAALATAGAQYLGRSIRRPSFRWSYLGMAMMLAAWCLELALRDVAQPQFYAIPGGLYLMLIGYLERQRGNKRLAVLIEGLGMAVLLVTSFVQSLSEQGSFPYFLLLMAECLLVTWYGAVQHYKSPFLTGLGASLVSVLAQSGW